MKNFKNPCCEQIKLENFRDLGHAAGCDFDLLKCTSCGSQVMAVWIEALSDSERGPHYIKLQNEDVKKFIATTPGPERRKILQEWWESLD